MNRSTLLAGSLAVPLASLALAFQGGTIPEEAMEISSIAWPSGPEWGSSARFSGTAYAQVTNLPGTDTALVRGGRLFLVVGSKEMGALLRVDDTLTDIVDICALPGEGVDAPDAIAFISPSLGLGKITYDALTNDFDVTVLDSGWATTTRLVNGDLDGDGDANDLAAADGASVRTLEHDGSGYVPGSTYSFSGPVTDLALPDYDWDGDLDIAAVVGTGLQFKGLGVTPPALVGWHPGSAIAVVPRPAGGPAGDYLAWCREGATGGVWSIVLSHAAGQEGPVAVGTDIVGLVAADLDGDGNVDLSPYGTREHRIPVYYNSGASPHFSAAPASAFTYDLTLGTAWAPMPMNSGRPAIIGAAVGAYPVILYPLDDSNEVAQLVGPFEGSVTPSLPETSIFAGSYDLVDSTDRNSEGILHVFIDLPNTFDIGSYDHVEVCQWRQNAVGGYPTGLAETYAYFELPADNTGNPDLRFRVEVPIHEPFNSIWPTSGPHYYHYLRIVKLSPSKKVVLAETSTILVGWRVRDNDVNDDQYMDYLRSQPTAGTEYTFYLGVVPPYPGGVSVGGGVTLQTAPAFNPFEKPQLPQPPSYGQAIPWL